jgi:hypothetical protein
MILFKIGRKTYEKIRNFFKGLLIFFCFYYYYYYQWGWTRPSHSGWAETGPAQFSRVGATGGPTVSLSLSLF